MTILILLVVVYLGIIARGTNPEGVARFQAIARRVVLALLVVFGLFLLAAGVGVHHIYSEVQQQRQIDANGLPDCGDHFVTADGHCE